MEKTIEIPEGYEARIEGNKVIFESKESEDERIRKEIIRIVNIWTDSVPTVNGIPVENLLAWLEKVQPQPKQEWSQTDNELADEAIACVTRCYEEYKDNKEFYQSLHHNTLDIKRWLINVRKKLTPHWKPSDEQMQALEHVVQYHYFANTDNKEKIVALFNDLKKLKR